MEILWCRKIETEEEKAVSEYLVSKSEILEYIHELVLMNNLLSVTLTHRTCDTNFFTYEFKRDNISDKFYVLVWRGLRSGDTSPLIFGRVVDEKINFEKTSYKR